jgi:Bacterial SH3 domain
MLRLILAITCLGSGGVAVAEPVRLTDEAIRRDLAGATLKIDTPVNTTIPVRVGADGFVSGEAGALASMLGAAKDRGRWWTDRDQLCVKWFRWFDAKPRCITLQREGSRIYWRDQEGESGTATLEEVQRAALAPVESHTAENGNEAVTAVANALPPNIEQASIPTTEPSDAVPSLRFSPPALGEIVAMAAPDAGMSRLGADVAPLQAPPASKEATPNRPSEPAASPSIRLSPANAATRAGAVQARIAFHVAGVDAGDTLNVRSGPSEYHQAVGRLSPEGRGVQIIGVCRDVWCPIQHGGVVGWVNRYYLAEDERPIEIDGGARPPQVRD